jgi:hypothetical protein
LEKGAIATFDDLKKKFHFSKENFVIYVNNNKIKKLNYNFFINDKKVTKKDVIKVLKDKK